MLRSTIFVGVFLLPMLAYAQQQMHWYYCDPAHAYYPYVSTCPIPWREVALDQFGPQQPGTDATTSRPTTSAPVPLTPSPTATPTPSPLGSQPSPAFQQGQADRQSWETWLNSETGDARAGADYWASHRSLPKPESCSANPPSTGADWTAGCFAAQQRLAAADVRRKTEPEYRRGFNNPPAAGSAAAPASLPANPAPVPHKGRWARQRHCPSLRQPLYRAATHMPICLEKNNSKIPRTIKARNTYQRVLVIL